MNKKGFLVVAAVAALALLIFAYSKMNSHSQNRPDAENGGDQSELLSKISDTSLSPKERYDALIQLGPRGGDLQLCKKYLEQTKDVLLRQGAAQCLGFMNNEQALRSLSMQLESPSELIRRSVLEALGRNNSPGRKEVIMNHLDNDQITDLEKSTAYISLVRIQKMEGASDPEAKSLSALIALLEQQSTTSQRHIIMQLINLLPESPQVVSILRHKVYEAKDPEVLASGIRHLSAIKDEWIVSQFDRFTKHPEAKVRKAVVTSLHLACPEDRWRLLNRMAQNEKEPEVLDTILKEPLQMKGPEALKFYENVRSLFAGQPAQTNQIAGYIQLAGEKPLINHCSR